MGNPRALVIGTGAGGLSAAAYLAREGFEVTALEQAEHPGGYLNPFSREGYRFDVGLHYVGECRPGQLTHQTLAGLGIDASGLFRELDPDGFDVFRFPDLEVRRCRGLDAYRERLTRLFPKEATGLDRFFSVVKRVDRAMKALTGSFDGQTWRMPMLRAAATLGRWSRWTFGELLEATVHDRRLRSVLAAESGTYGVPPGRASALAAMQVLLHYADGAFYPRGGAGGLRDALIDAAEKHGARIRTHARVERLLIVEHQVAGVELTDGEQLPADVVISDADPVATFSGLLEVATLPSSLRRKVQRITLSPSTAILYLGMRRDLGAELGDHNLWTYPDWDLDAVYAPIFAREPRLSELPARPSLFIASASARDPACSMAPAGCSTLEVLTFSPYDAWSRWADTPIGKRGTDYELEKHRTTARILDELERQLPGLVGDVVVQELSTPLTNEGYTLATGGAAYGPAEIPSQSGFRRFRTATPLRNLFLAGAGVFAEGIAACLLSGKVAAQLARASVVRHRPAETYAPMA